MFERFSDNARQAVVLAQVECRRLNHRSIGTEHLLLGLLGMPDSSAGRALGRLGLSQESARAEVEQLVGRGERPPSGHVPFTPRAKKVLELSLREALKLKHNYIGSAHILLAIVREGEGVAAQALRLRLGELDKLRQAALAEIRGGSQRPAATARTPAAEEVLRLAEQLAAGAPVGSHHLLEALARSHRSMAAQVLAGFGVDPENIAARLDTIDLESTSDITPELSAATKMRLRLDGDEVHLVLGDAETVELVRLLTKLAGGELTGAEPLTGSFVGLWASVRDGLAALHRTLAVEPGAAEGEPEQGRSPARAVRDRLRGRRRPPERPEG
jgi:ATP-dependent Clp protease ATP-binding subunit ClpC